MNFGGNKPWRDPAGSSCYGNDEDKSQKRRLQVRTIVQLFSISFLFKNYETHNTTELRISNEVLLT